MIVAGSPFRRMTRPLTAGIRREAALPQAVRDEHEPLAVFVPRRERPADDRLDAEDLEELRTDAHGADPLGLAVAREIDLLGAHRRETLEGGLPG